MNWGAYIEDIIRITPNWLLTASGRVDHWQNFDAFAPPNPALAGRRRSPARSQRDLLQSAPGASAQAHQQCLSDRFRLPRLPRSHSERTLSRFSRGQCVYRVQSESPRRTPDRRGRRRHRHRLESARDAAQQFFLEPDHAPRGQCHVDHDSQPDHPAAPESGKHSCPREWNSKPADRLSNSVTVSGGYQYTDATVTSFTVDPALAGLNPSLVGLDVPQIPRHQFTFQAQLLPAVHSACGAGTLWREPVRRRSEHTVAAGAISSWTPPRRTTCVMAWICLSRWRI